MARSGKREGRSRPRWRNPFRRRKVAQDAAEGSNASEETAPSGVAALLRPVPHADRFTMQDLVAEATADIGARPGRLIMTTLGTVLGIGALVATIGFAETTAGQIASQFDAVAQTTVQVTPAKARTGGDKTAPAGRLPWDAPERVMTLVGVEGAALISEVSLGSETITAVPIVDPSAAQKAPPSLVAASGDLLATLHAKVTSGRMFDAGHDQRADRVAVLGAGAAESLGVLRIDRQPAIFISGIPYAVIGIVDDFQRRSDLRDAVIIPSQAASADFRLGAPSELQIQIDVGAGPQVAEQAPLVLAPNAPETLEAAAPPARSSLASNVQADVNFVFLILGGIVLLAGALGIANVTLLNVMERVGEIGLRRAVGATRRQIATQFMVESVIIGLLGGLIGASVGVFAIVIVSLTQGWTPVVQPWVAIGGALLGAVVGWLAGAYPAGRAARIEPVAALRGS